MAFDKSGEGTINKEEFAECIEFTMKE